MKINKELLARVAADPAWAAEVLAAAAMAYNALQDGLPRCRHCRGETTADGDSVVLSARSTLATAFMEPFDLEGAGK
jgi:hypothetical protein